MAQTEHRLADGRRVSIRPVRPGDEAAEQRFLERLSRETRRLRFMGFAAPVDADLAHFYTHVDYDRHMAFVCEHEGELVGEARYVGNPDRRSCELGIVVADEWHHTGIAQLLIDALMRYARLRGYETLEGVVLRDNPSMLDFVRALGFEVAPEAHEPTLVRVVKKLRD
jgi:acetyltransferase